MKKRNHLLTKGLAGKQKLGFLIFFLTAISCGGLCQGGTRAFMSDSLDVYIQEGLAKWKIPGVAICIIKEGKVVLEKGYGIREQGKPEKVNAQTLFMIGSNTKAFTATALSMLDDKKKISLDDKVIRWLPDFKLYDPWVTKEATIRDLLCHRLGFETFQGDFMYFNSDLTSAAVLQKLAMVKPLYGFRSRWGYCNAAFLTAGEIIPKVTGKSWADFIKEQLFIPLGMYRSLALSAQLPSDTNKAAAHTLVEEKLQKIPYGHIDNLAPAGSISSSAHDMGRWVSMLLNQGTQDGREIMDAGAISETWLPHSILGNGGHRFNPAHFNLYGLGWFLQEYNGRKLVAHTGGVNGFVTGVTLVPEEKLGIIVLTNTDANQFFESLKWEILDAYLNLPYRNYSNLDVSRYKTRAQKANKELQNKKILAASHPQPVLPLKAYTGSYKHTVYGTMTITLEGGALVARFEHHKKINVILQALGKNVFWAIFNDPLYGTPDWEFQTKAEKVVSVTVSVSDFIEYTLYEFTKIN